MPRQDPAYYDLNKDRPHPIFDPEGEYRSLNNITQLVEYLRGELGKFGYYFDISPTWIGDEFYRVYVTKGAKAAIEGQASLFLDLRVGPSSPTGRTVEMAGSKPGIVTMPGFARHIAGRQKIDTPRETFKDFIEAVFDKAAQEGKPPQQMVWSVYQEGSPSYNLPGARDWGEESPYPKVGGVLTPSSSSGKRQLMASTVRYAAPGGYIDQQEYIKQTMELIKAGKLKELTGYGPEVNKWKAWIPLSSRFEEPEVGMRRPKIYDIERTLLKEPGIFQARSETGTVKSVSTITGARELADVPFRRFKRFVDGKLVEGLERIEPTKPGTGEGLREGWTVSSVVLPGELKPNVVYSKQMGLVDQPDLPGAVYASKDAWKSSQGETVKIGEAGVEQYRFGIQTVDELQEMIDKGLEFDETEGLNIKPGDDKERIGRYWSGKLTEKGKKEYINLMINRRAYGMIGSKMTLHIPEFYDPSQGNEFSNVPVYDEEGNLVRTTAFVEKLKQKYGDRINIVGYSSRGSKLHTGGEETGTPAEVYLNLPTARAMPISMKGPGGLKAYVAQLNKQLTFKLLGHGQEDMPVDFVTQEAKIPTRVLQSSFGVMNLQTQLNFIDRFFPGNARAVSAVKEMVKDAYSSDKFQVQINLDRMAEIWETETGKPTSADSLFAAVFKKILSVRDEQEALNMRKQFGIGLPITQMAEGTIYTEDEMLEMKRILREQQDASRGRTDYTKMIDFVEYKPPLDSADELLKATQMFGEDIVNAPLYQLKYKVQQGQAVTLQYGASFVSEYPSESGYLGPKAIMSMIEHYPKMATAMGLMDKRAPGKWLGPLSRKPYGGKGLPDPSVRGWNELFFWRMFQKEVMGTGGDLMLPHNTTVIDEQLAGALTEIIVDADNAPTSEEKLKVLKKRLKDLPSETVGLPEKVDLTERYLFDVNSMTLLPKLTSIMDIEHYGEGAREGMTETYFGDNYMRLLKSAVESAQSAPGSLMNVANSARNLFYRRITASFSPGERRSKEIMRNITGVRMPGARQGRYQGMSGLEVGEAYATEDFVREQLLAGGYKTGAEAERIIQWWQTNPDAYLPVLFQRFPDISTRHIMIPVKVRSVTHLRAKGISVPEGGPGASDMFFIGSSGNRVSVGDYDADQAGSWLLPLWENAKTGGWSMDAEVQREFDKTYRRLYKTTGGVTAALEYMFGNLGKTTGIDTLDVAAKNLQDFLEGFKNKQSSLTKRLEEPSELHSFTTALEAAAEVADFKSAMGRSYNIREQLQDIPGFALPGRRTKQIVSDAAERAGLPYQLYLDRSQAVRAGLTQLETLMTTFGIYEPYGDPEKMSYRVGFMYSAQGSDRPAYQRSDPSQWVRAGSHGLRDTGWMMRILMGAVADLTPTQSRMKREKGIDPIRFASDEMLAYGFSLPGKDKEVLEALQDPEQYWMSRGIAKSRIEEWSDEIRSDRGLVLNSLFSAGKVGFRSPYYMMFAYKAIERFAKQFPEYVQDPSVRIPWLDGKMTPIQKIMESKEYKRISIADRMLIGSTESITVDEMELLAKSSKGRAGSVLAGIYRSYMETTAGKGVEIIKGESELQERWKEAGEIYRENVMKMDPVIHASELGTLNPAPKNLIEQGWRTTGEQTQIENAYRVILRSTGLGFVMADKMGEMTKFLKIDFRAFPEDRPVEGGIVYEQEYAQAHPELVHVGQVSRSWEDVSDEEMQRRRLGIDISHLTEGNNLRYREAGIEIRGTPDFVSYDDSTNSFVIIDTKQPAGFGAGRTSAEEAQAHVKQFRYYMQQVAYAYGLEKKAKSSTLQEWTQFMRGWRVTDEKMAEKMYDAAQRGKFKISLAPGRFTKEGGLEELQKVSIPYGEDVKREFVDYLKEVKEVGFGPKGYGFMATQLYSALSKQRGYPAGLSFYKRMEGALEPALLSGLKRVGMETGYLPRAAGGYDFSWTPKGSSETYYPKEIKFARGYIKAVNEAVKQLGLTEKLIKKYDNLSIKVRQPGAMYVEDVWEGTPKEEAVRRASTWGGFWSIRRNTVNLVGFDEEEWAKRTGGMLADPAVYVKSILAHEIGHFSYDSKKALREDIDALVNEEIRMILANPERPSSLSLKKLTKAYGSGKAAIEGYRTELTASYFEAAARMTDPIYRSYKKGDLDKLWQHVWEQNAYAEEGNVPLVSPIAPPDSKNEPAYKKRIRKFLVKAITKNRFLQAIDPETTDWKRLGLVKDIAELRGMDDRLVAVSKILKRTSSPGGIHVGEGGPEDVVIDEGGVTIVPTSHLPEAKAMRGEGRGGAGVTDIRASKRGTRIRVGELGPEDIEIVGNEVRTSSGKKMGFRQTARLYKEAMQFANEKYGRAKLSGLLGEVGEFLEPGISMSERFGELSDVLHSALRMSGSTVLGLAAYKTAQKNALRYLKYGDIRSPRNLPGKPRFSGGDTEPFIESEQKGSMGSPEFIDSARNIVPPVEEEQVTTSRELSVGNTPTTQGSSNMSMEQAQTMIDDLYRMISTGRGAPVNIPSELLGQIPGFVEDVHNIASTFGGMQTVLGQLAEGKIVFQGRAPVVEEISTMARMRSRLNIAMGGIGVVEKYEADVREALSTALRGRGFGELLESYENVPSAKVLTGLAIEKLGTRGYLRTMAKAGLGAKRARSVERIGKSITDLMKDVAKAGGFDEYLASDVGKQLDPETKQELERFRDWTLSRAIPEPERLEKIAELEGKIEETLPHLTSQQKGWRTRTQNRLAVLAQERVAYEGEMEHLRETGTRRGDYSVVPRMTELTLQDVERQKEIDMLEGKLTGYEEIENRPLTPAEKGKITKWRKKLDVLQNPPGTPVNLEEGLAAAQTVKGFAGEPELKEPRWIGATASTLEKLADVTDRTITAMEEYEKVHKAGKDTEEKWISLRKTQLEQEAVQKLASAEKAVFAVSEEFPQLYPEGKYVGARKALEMAKAGKVEDIGFELSAVAESDLRQAEGEVEERELEAKKGVPSKFGRVARRMFGGFGLMYLRSIAGLVGTGAYTGYGERIQMERQMAEPFLGLGGEVPYEELTQQQRVLAYQYGGSGARTFQYVKDYLMREQQPTYQALTTGLAGVSAAGMMAWLTGEQGFNIGEQKGNRLAIGTGIAVGALSEILNIVGASQDVEGTAMNLAIRRARGENLATSALTSAILSGASGAALGAGFGGLPGAIIGAGAGLLVGTLSNSQQIAAAFSPEIQKQQAIIEALANRTGGIQQVMTAYSIPQEQQAYYARLAAQVQSLKPENLGISDQALAQAAAIELRRGVNLGAEGTTRIGSLLQGGYDVDAFAGLAARAMGMSVFEATEGIPSNRMVESVVQQLGVKTTPEMISYGELGIEPPDWVKAQAGLEPTSRLVPSGRMVQAPDETMQGRLIEALTDWAERQPNAATATERQEAAFQAIAQMGQVGVEEFKRRMQAEPGFGPSEARRQSVDQWRTDYAMRYGQELAGLEATGWLAPYQALTESAMRRKALGLTAREVPTVEEYRRLHPEANAEQVAAAMQQIEEYGITETLTAQMRRQAVGSLGFVPTYAPNIGNLGLQQMMGQIQFGAGLAQTFMQGGLGEQYAGALGGAFALMNPQQYYQYKQLFSGSPLQMGAWMMQNPQLAAGIMQGGTVRGLGGTALNPMFMGMTDIGPMGNLTGMNWGTTSLALPAQVAQMMAGGMPSYGAVAASSANVANMIWGDWQNRTDVSQGLIKAMISGGQFGGQAWQQLQQAQYSMAQAGVQIAQLQLQAEYMPKFWSIEDRQRALGYRQTEWGFQQQEQQLALQRENFAFQTGMQQRQMQLQRGWTQEDWAYQAEVRGLQWQWRQEDYAEQLRFMTGRDRRLAQRQMGRETTLYEMESEQIEKTKDRQKELWAMEDERFAQQVAYQTRIMDMQEQNLNKQRQFFEERKALEAESVELQREYWQKQWDLNMQAAGAAAAYAASQAEIAQTMMEFSQTTDTWTSQGNLFDPATMADLATALESIDANFSGFVDEAERLATLMGWEQKATDEETVFETPDDNGDGDDDDGYPMLQHGGRAYPGSSYLVGERGMELFTPDLAGTVRPLDPWGMTISSNVVDSSASVPIHLIVHLGDEILIDRVLNAVDQEIRE